MAKDQGLSNKIEEILSIVTEMDGKSTQPRFEEILSLMKEMAGKKENGEEPGEDGTTSHCFLKGKNKMDRKSWLRTENIETRHPRRCLLLGTARHSTECSSGRTCRRRRQEVGRSASVALPLQFRNRGRALHTVLQASGFCPG